MNFLGKLFEGVDHDAKPLLTAAGKWAEDEGVFIVKQVELELKTKGTTELIELFNQYVGPLLGGITWPAGATLTTGATDLLATALGRSMATTVSGTALRASVLNAGLEQAVLLVKGAGGDAVTVPAAVPAGGR